MFAAMTETDNTYDDVIVIYSMETWSLGSNHGKQSQKVSVTVIFRMGIAKGVDVRILPSGLSLALV